MSEARSSRGRKVRQIIKIFAFLAFVGGVALGSLLLLTPSAETATALVRAQAATHGISYTAAPPPPHFAKALVATEDQRFYSPFNLGIDPFAIARAILAEIKAPRGDPGGSTIAQQLAKMLYTPGRDGLAAKFEQVALAVKLSLTYSKEQILAMYTTVAYFGGGYYGLAAASCGYFDVQPADLTWRQAAMLAGIVNAPTADNPRTHLDRAHARSMHVFDRLVAMRVLTRAEADAALAQPLALVAGHCNRP